MLLEPCMFHVTKDEEKFYQLSLKLRIGNSGLVDLKILGIDIE